MLAGQQPELVPTLLHRSDGQALLYPGRIHCLQGEPESLKSWLAQVAVAEVLKAEQPVLYLDFEDSPGSVVSRLRALGCTPQQIGSHLQYVQPTEPLPGRQLPNHLLQLPPTMVVVDAVTEAMSILGLDLKDNANVAEFYRILPRPFASAGSTVTLIDHLTKEASGRFALGAQHKLAAIDGAAYKLSIGKPFGRDGAGTTRIDVVKDRHGFIRGMAQGNHVADLHLQSQPDGSVSADLRAPGDFRPTFLMQRISELLEAEHPRALKTTEIYRVVHGKQDAKQRALELLVDEGWVHREFGARNSHNHRHQRPFQP